MSSRRLRLSSPPQHPQQHGPELSTTAESVTDASVVIDDNNIKLQQPIALNGISSTVEDRNNDFLCPICFDLMKEAHITRCGHTFCYQCILKSVARFNRCPKCSFIIQSADQIFPNYLLDELISKYNAKLHLQQAGCYTNSSSTGNLENIDGLKKFLTAESQKLTLPDVNIMLEILNQRKQILEAESSAAQNRLLYEFLKHLLKQKEEQQTQVQREINLVKRDLESVENTLRNVGGTTTDAAAETSSTRRTTSVDDETIKKDMPTTSSRNVESGGSKNDIIFSGPTISTNIENLVDSTSKANFLSRKRRMYCHFDDFVSSYFSARSQELYLGSDSANEGGSSGVGDSSNRMEIDDKLKMSGSNISLKQGLDVFRENLVKFSRYSGLRPLATMHYSSDLHISSTIVSTIVFDKDNEYFAIGGVTKRIKIYDYLAVIRDTVDIHYPCVEMVSNSKISCIAWNSYHKNILASSDYEGAVNIWDVTTGQRTKCFHEHEKRCWSVDFNEVDTRLIVSGSDDARVKLWSLKDEHSIATLEAKANVCCVKFNPKSSCHLAFGSADHDVHYYDLRNMTKAICIFKGHKKAVSYVKFLNTNEIISASTDSQLKLWNVNSPPYCLRSFTGHINEKNFVGLATDGDYIACGSEDNSLYVYYKGLSKQLFSYKIDVGQRVSDLERSNDLNEFVSAVCWRKQCNVILAANSRGLIKVLELV